MKFTISNAALSMLSHANQDDPGYEFLVSGGDLQQMGTQYHFLKANGFDVGRRDVYPALKTKEDYLQAVRAIFEARVAGWWNLRHELISNGICTEEEFQALLTK